MTYENDDLLFELQRTAAMMRRAQHGACAPHGHGGPDGPHGHGGSHGSHGHGGHGGHGEADNPNEWRGVACGPNGGPHGPHGAPGFAMRGGPYAPGSQGGPHPHAHRGPYNPHAFGEHGPTWYAGPQGGHDGSHHHHGPHGHGAPEPFAEGQLPCPEAKDGGLEDGKPRRKGEGRHGQMRILAMLCMQDGVSQKDLAYLLGIRPQSLTVALEKLEADGYIERKQDEDDKRARKVFVTEAGREKSAEAEASRKQRAEGVLSVLTEEEKQQLAAILAKLNGALDA